MLGPTKFLVALSAILPHLAYTLPTPEQSPPAHVIWQPISPKNAWLECLTSRSNGNLLVTRYDTGEIWTVDPSTQEASLVYAFPSSANVNSSLGIDEYADDMFVFVAGQVTPGERLPIAGSWGVWSIDLRNWAPPTGGNTSRSEQPAVTLVAKVPEALMLNGLAALNRATTVGPRAKGNDSEPVAILADSTAGVLYSLNLTGENKTASVFYSNPAVLAPSEDSAFPTGLNGLQVPLVRRPKHIYFTTGFRGAFYRLALSPTSPSVAPAAELELLAEGYYNLDDFSLEADGTAYLSTSSASQIVRVSPNGEESVVIESDIVNSATATHLMERDGKKLLYVNTGSASNFGDGSPGHLVEIWL